MKSVGRYGDDAPTYANDVLANAAAFIKGVQENASLLPKNFHPFPATESEFRKIAPGHTSKPEEQATTSERPGATERQPAPREAQETVDLTPEEIARIEAEHTPINAD